MWLVINSGDIYLNAGRHIWLRQCGGWRLLVRPRGSCEHRTDNRWEKELDSWMSRRLPWDHLQLAAIVLLIASKLYWPNCTVWSFLLKWDRYHAAFMSWNDGFSREEHAACLTSPRRLQAARSYTSDCRFKTYTQEDVLSKYGRICFHDTIIRHLR